MAINDRSMDSGFKYEVTARPGAENLTACFSCGVCTASCPVSEVESDYNPRKLVRMIVWGLREELLSSELIWLCNSCYSCYAHCPQDVKFTDVITVLREMAVEEGHVDESFEETVDDIDRLMQKVRRELVKQVMESDGQVVEDEDLELETVAAQLMSAGERGDGSPCPQSEKNDR